MGPERLCPPSARVGRKVLVAIALLLLAASQAIAPDRAGAQEAPSITVTPSTELVEGQILSVSGTGFLPSTTVYVVPCPAAVINGIDCDLNVLTSTQTDATGAFTTTYVARRFIVGNVGGVPTELDCATDACMLGAGDAGQVRTANTPIDFADDPLPPRTLTAIPNGDAFGAAEVTGTGFAPGAPVYLQFCGPVIPGDCSPFTSSAVADATGAFSAVVAVNRIPGPLLPFSDFDCLVDDCVVRALRAGALLATSAPVEFPTPQLTVAIEPEGTLDATTGEAVVSARVSCDFSTPLSVLGTISQSDITGSFSIESEFCVGGDPLLVVIPGRDLTPPDGDFTLGQASVTISATPFRSLAEGTTADTTASVELVDFGAAKAVVDEQLADPGNTELRALVLEAIYARIRQDPVFRELFAAALRGD
jgi:hypothetical protein